MITPREIEEKAIRKFKSYLVSVIDGTSIFPLFIVANKKGSPDFSVRHKELEQLIGKSKERLGFGYSLQYKTVNTRKHGIQDEIEAICFNTEEDYIQFLNKQDAIVSYKNQLQWLLQWRPAVKSWLVLSPSSIFDYLLCWKEICSVVDFLIKHDVSGYYLRSLPVPVHTKFISQYQTVIFSLLQHLEPGRFTTEITDTEEILGLRRKPYLFTLRWLDKPMATECSSGMTIFATTVDYLKTIDWPVRQIIFVENETNLYLLPVIKNTLAIFSAGKALHLLREIPMLNLSALYYWGDLDEDGFTMLNDIRGLYPQIKSLLMDENTIAFHQHEMDKQPAKYKHRVLTNLTDNESRAFNIVSTVNGRIEQEKLKQDYIQQIIQSLFLQ